MQFQTFFCQKVDTDTGDLVPLTLANIYVYAAGTTTPQNIYSDPGGTDLITQPANSSPTTGEVQFATADGLVDIKVESSDASFSYTIENVQFADVSSIVSTCSGYAASAATSSSSAAASATSAGTAATAAATSATASATSATAAAASATAAAASAALAPQAWVAGHWDGSAITIYKAVNVTSVAHASTGVLTVTLTGTPTITCVDGEGQQTSAVPLRSSGIGTPSTTNPRACTFLDPTGTLVDPTDFFLRFY